LLGAALVAAKLFHDDAGAPGKAAGDGAVAAHSASDEVRSPFAPWGGGESRDVAAAIAGARLIGVRVAADPVRSGAVIAMPDGAQRAFAVGQEIAPGVRLAAIDLDHVVLAAADAEHRLVLEGYSTRPGATMIASAPAPAQPAVNPREAVAWLSQILIRPEESVGAPYGWRIIGPVPPVAAQAGLQTGDLILAVNGARPTSGAIRLDGDATGQPIQLSVVRSSGERITIALARSRT
jgi:general secretion pathway protein C